MTAAALAQAIETPEPERYAYLSDTTGERGCENQFTAYVDAAGYVVGGLLTRERGDYRVAARAAREARKQYPVDQTDIVMPLTHEGMRWPVDADGRGLAYLEVYPARRNHRTRRP